MKAIWNNTIIAKSDETVVVENNHYFPPDSVDMKLLKKNGDEYECPWKGTAYYYDITVDGETKAGAAFSYPEPSEKAKKIAGYFAFWKEVAVIE
jgi:uncharacterized protein (DUF427 family)